ncbi:4Fe-4S ferredoxin, partial [Halorubrum sp. SP3]
MSTDDESMYTTVDEEDRRLLEETGFDADLGAEMARDAQRVAADELSEVEFYRRYHDRILEEFDVDDREVDIPDPDEVDEEDVSAV